MGKIILVMGLPGSGKTTLAKMLADKLEAPLLNADEIREAYNDWDFTAEGRLRQTKRMKKLADKLALDCDYVIADFICPRPRLRRLFSPHYIIWMDTIEEGRYEDTNQYFIPPRKFHIKVSKMDADTWSELILKDILGEDYKGEEDE